MKNFFTLTLALLISVPSFAADSSWLICDDGHLVVNSFEHRAGAETRATEITMIYGMHVLKGSLSNVDEGTIALGGKNDSFHGKISIDYKKLSVAVAGTLILQSEKSDVESVLSCKEMEGSL